MASNGSRPRRARPSELAGDLSPTEDEGDKSRSPPLRPRRVLAFALLALLLCTGALYSGALLAPPAAASSRPAGSRPPNARIASSGRTWPPPPGVDGVIRGDVVGNKCLCK